MDRGVTMIDHKLEHLVMRLKKGDMSVFDDIYEQTKTKVYYTILTVLKDASLAEDIMQDTYLKMLEKIHQYKVQKSFSAWITLIAKNLAINEYHKRSKEVMMPEDAENYLLPKTNPQSENTYYLQELLKVLTPTEREIVIRHTILEEKHKTIAKALNKPLGTITWSYQNALKKLRKEAHDDEE